MAIRSLAVGGFELKLPVLTIVDVRQAATYNLVLAMRTVTRTQTGEKFVLLFTERLIARRHRRQRQLVGSEIVPLRPISILRSVLAGVLQHGLHNAAIDFTTFQSWHSVPVASIIAAIDALPTDP